MRRREFLAAVGVTAIAGCQAPADDGGDNDHGPAMRSGGFKSGGGSS